MVVPTNHNVLTYTQIEQRLLNLESEFERLTEVNNQLQLSNYSLEITVESIEEKVKKIISETIIQHNKVEYIDKTVEEIYVNFKNYHKSEKLRINTKFDTITNRIDNIEIKIDSLTIDFENLSISEN